MAPSLFLATIVRARLRGTPFRELAATGSGRPRRDGSLVRRFHVTPILDLIVLLWFVAPMVSCSPQQVVRGQVGEAMPNKAIEEVLQERTASLMAIPGVVGTAQGLCSGEPCIRVFVVGKTDELVKQIPVEIDGYPVDVQETGEFRKLDPG